MAILVSRLAMLPREKVEVEIAYLKSAIEKTAGPEESEAWSWLMEKVERFYKTRNASCAGLPAHRAATAGWSCYPQTAFHLLAASVASVSPKISAIG